MLKKLLVLGFLIGVLSWPFSLAQAEHVVPQPNIPVQLTNFCLDTPKYFDEITMLNATKSWSAAKDRWAEVMKDPSIPCYNGTRAPAMLVRLVSETLLKNGTGKCFNSQVWEAKLAGVKYKERKAYTNMHFKCPTES